MRKEPATAPPLRTSVEIAAPPEAVFPYLTRPEAIVTWMGDYAILDAAPGGVFHLDINGVPVRGRYLEIDPPRRLVISWGHAGSNRLPPGASTVEITLTPIPDGTRLTVTHHGLPPEDTAQHATGWPHFLGRLTIAATGADPGPDPFTTTTPPGTRGNRRPGRYKAARKRNMPTPAPGAPSTNQNDTPPANPGAAQSAIRNVMYRTATAI